MELGDAFETIGRGLATGTKTKKHSLQCNLDEPGPSKSRKKPREKKSKKAVVDDERQLSASLVLDDDMDITHKRHNTKGVVTGTEDDSGATLVVVDDAPPPQESLQKKQPVNDIMEEDDVLSIHVEIIETVSQSLECSPPRPPSFPAATSAPSIPIIKNPQPDQSVVSRKPSKKVKMPASSSTTTAKPKPASKAKTDGKPPRKPRSKKAPLQTSLLPVTDALRTLESNLSDRLGSLLHSLKSQTTTTSQTKTSKYFYDPPLVPPKPCNIRNFVVESRSQSIEFCKPSRASLWERAGREFSQESLDNAPSTPALEEAIAQVRTSYDSRIQSASDRLKRKIREMELEHQNWVTKEEEECQEIIECLMRNHAFQKGVRAEVLCPQPPPVAPAHEDDEPVALLNDACNQDQQAQIEMDLAEDYLNGNISEDLGSTTPQKSRDVPTACCFNLSSPESSLGVDDDILLDVL